MTKYQKHNYKQKVNVINGNKIYAILYCGYKQGHIVIDRHGKKYPRQRSHWYTAMTVAGAYQAYLNSTRRHNGV
jgi:hypothetical protein